MGRTIPNRSSKNDFAAAAWKRWEWLGKELQADVTEFNSREGGIDFSQTGPDQFLVSNVRSGLQLTVTADFDGRTVRYEYEQLNDKSAGVPDGGMLSMRQPPGSVVELVFGRSATYFRRNAESPARAGAGAAAGSLKSRVIHGTPGQVW